MNFEGKYCTCYGCTSKVGSIKIESPIKIKIDLISLNNTKYYNNICVGNNDQSLAHALLQDVTDEAYSRLISKILKKQ